MKKQNIVVLVIAVAIGAILLIDHFGIVRVKDVLNPDTSRAGQDQATAVTRLNQPAMNNPVAASLQTDLQQEFIGKLVGSITPDQRMALLQDGNAFKTFVNQEAINLSLLQAAQSSNLQSDTNVQFLMQRAGDNVVREIYITRLINSKIPADFPSDQQVQEYYDNNKDSLKLGERLSVWQIFLPVTAGMDETAAASVATVADRVAEELRTGKLDFAVAALEYSRHDPSRVNGGYMGIIKTAELIPEILKVIQDLEVGEISPAVKSPMGYHILKRDDIMPAQELELDLIRAEVKSLMINQARAQLRKSINDEVLKTYPVVVDDSVIEQWRQALLTNGQ